MAQDSNVYCSLCGKPIIECKCKRTIPVETKDVKPAETK